MGVRLVTEIGLGILAERLRVSYHVAEALKGHPVLRLGLEP